MADLSKLGCDSLRIYHSGASSAGAAQTVESDCLGGYISSTEVKTYDISVANAIANVSILMASGSLPAGNVTKVICTATDTVKLQVNGVDGSTVTLADGNTVQINMNNVGSPEHFVRLSRSGTMATGTATLTLSTRVNNVYAGQDIDSTDAGTGIDQYRMIALKNETAAPITNLRIWLPKLGTQLISAVAQLGSSGSGTIQVTGGTNLNDWPATGWCRIEQSTGALREVVYYSSRTSTVLTVPSTGRARLGTTAAAGASTDKIFPIPGMRIALDADGVDAASHLYDVIADENTEPVIDGDWACGGDDDDTLGNALLIDTIASGSVVPIWIHKEIPEGAKATTTSYNGIVYCFDGTF